MKNSTIFSLITADYYFGIKDGGLVSYPIAELTKIFDRFPDLAYCFLTVDNDVLKESKIPNTKVKVMLKSEWDRFNFSTYFSAVEMMRFFTLYFNRFDSLALKTEYQIENFPKQLNSWMEFSAATPKMYHYPTDAIGFLLWLQAQEVILPASNNIVTHSIKLSEFMIDEDPKLDLSIFVDVAFSDINDWKGIPELAVHRLDNRKPKPKTYAFSMAEFKCICAKLKDKESDAILYIHEFKDKCSLSKLLPSNLEGGLSLINFWAFSHFLHNLQNNPEMKLAYRFLYELLMLWYLEQGITHFSLTQYYMDDNAHIGFLLSEGMVAAAAKTTNNFVAKRGGRFGS